MGLLRVRSHVRYWRTSRKKELKGNPKGKTVGRKKRLETFCSVHPKQKQFFLLTLHQLWDLILTLWFVLLSFVKGEPENYTKNCKI
jgi:hypothetical protein